MRRATGGRRRCGLLEPPPPAGGHEAGRAAPRPEARSISCPPSERGAVLAIAAALACTGCTSREVYEVTESLRIDDCRDIVKFEEREACEERAGMSYAEYEALRERETGSGDD